MAGASPAIRDPVSAGAVPGQADKQPSVMSPVGRPPFLGIGHQRPQIGFQAVVVEPCKGFGVHEACPEGIRGWVVLMEKTNFNLIWPPLLV